MQIKSKYYLGLLSLSTFFNLSTIIYLSTQNNNENLQGIDCIYYNCSITPNENINETCKEVCDRKKTCDMFLNNLYHNSSELFTKTLFSIRSYRDVFDRLNKDIVSNSSKINQILIQIKGDDFKKINKIYTDLVNYINGFRRIINEIETQKFFY